MSKNSDCEQLVNTVINNNFCIGCGICPYLKNSSFKMKMDKYGRYQTEYIPNSEDNNSYLRICPFSEKANNEDDIAQKLFKKDCKHNEKLGYYLNTYAGYVLEDDFRKNGSSGGMGSWILKELMENKLVDYVIHVDKNDQGGPLFKYKISKNIDEVKHGSSSRYFPITLSEVLKVVREQKGRYAIIGIPCFIKGIRLLSDNDPVIKERIKYSIGLVCGHLKTSKFSDLIARQMGVDPQEIIGLNFRKKIPGQYASDYAAEVTYKQNDKVITAFKNMKEIYGGNWGYGFFKYNACDYCDDVLSETADITIGDAWLPEYVNDSLGTNIIITRNKEIDQLLRETFKTKRLNLDYLSVERIIKSQEGGFRHRRDGLAYRLWIKKQKNKWAPIKRVEPLANHIKIIDKIIYRMRILITQKSLEYYMLAEKNNNLKYFIIPMKIYTGIYNSIYIFKGVINKFLFLK